MKVKNNSPWIAGYWIRFFAFVIDCMLLGAVGYVLGKLLESSVVGLGSSAQFIGMGIMLAYFGIMNSRIANGQTIGKKLMKLRVVNGQNETISLGQSVARYLVYTLPVIFGSLSALDSIFFTYLNVIFSALCFWAIFSIFYLYTFNRVTRQSLHDLAVGTYVVKAKAAPVGVDRVWKGHYAVVGLLLIPLVVIGVHLHTNRDINNEKALLSVTQHLETYPAVLEVKSSTTESSVTDEAGNSTTTDFVTAQVFLDQNLLDDEVLAKKMARDFAQIYPSSMGKDYIQVVLVYGYDIGIYSNWKQHVYKYKPTEL